MVISELSISTISMDIEISKANHSLPGVAKYELAMYGAMIGIINRKRMLFMKMLEHKWIVVSRLCFSSKRFSSFLRRRYAVILSVMIKLPRKLAKMLHRTPTPQKFKRRPPRIVPAMTPPIGQSSHRITRVGNTFLLSADQSVVNGLHARIMYIHTKAGISNPIASIRNKALPVIADAANRVIEALTSNSGMKPIVQK